MGNFYIGYEETTDTCHISGSHKFSKEEIEAFLKHFEKRHNCTIPDTDLIKKLVSGQPLSSSEEEIIRQTIGLDGLFNKFIDYVNIFLAKKYQHQLRPGCFEIAEKLRKVAGQITSKPRNQYKIEQLLTSVWKVEMPKSDSPIRLNIEDILKAVQKTNYTNHQAADYKDFKSRATWKKIDNFEVKYNPEQEKILFGSCEQDWYIIVDGAQPRTIQKEFMPSKGKKGYILELETGDTYVIYVTGYEGGNILKYDFVPQELPIQVS